MTTTEARETRPDQLAYSDSQCAAILGVSRPTFRKLLDNGEVRSFRLGARRLIPRSELEGYISRQMAAAS